MVLGLAALTAAVAVAGSGSGSFRQDDPDKDDKKKVKVDPADKGNDDRPKVKQNLFLVLKASPDDTEGSLRKMLVKGLKAANCTYTSLMIEPMSISTYNELDKVINKGVLPSITVSGAEGAGPVRISPATVNESAMVFRFADEYRDLQSLDLEFAGGKKMPGLKPLPRGKTPAQLPALIEGEVPGQYILKLDPKADPPLRYTAQIKNVKKKPSAVEALTGEFPKSPRCFMVLIENFEGERVELFNTLKDKNAVADPLDDINVSTEVRIAFAYWKTGNVGIGPDWSGNRYTLREEGLQRRRTARVWTLFPIKEGEADKLLDKYRAFDSEKLIKEIEREANLAKTNGNADITFGGNFEPSWILLNPSKPPPQESTMFARTLVLDNAQLAQIKKNYPKVYRLTVWEFEDQKGEGREAIPVQDEVTKTRVLVVKQEVKNWVPGITALSPGK